MILDFSRESLESRLSIYLNNQESKDLKDKEVFNFIFLKIISIKYHLKLIQKLINEYNRINKEIGENVKKPKNFSGYILVPEQFEFYQTNDYNCWIKNDRIRYSRSNEVVETNKNLIQGSHGWIIERLVP